MVRERIRERWSVREARAPLASRRYSPLSPMRRYVYERRSIAGRLDRLDRLEQLGAPRMIIDSERRILARKWERYRQAARRVGLPILRVQP